MALRRRSDIERNVGGIAAPLILTLASNAAKNTIMKNRLFPSELLNFLGDMSGKIKTKGVPDHKSGSSAVAGGENEFVTLRHFGLRFLDSKDYVEIGFETLSKRINMYLGRMGNEDKVGGNDFVLSKAENTADFFDAVESNPTPWFSSLRSFIRSNDLVRIHETFCVPVFFLILLTSEDDRPLLERDNLMGTFKKEIADRFKNNPLKAALSDLKDIPTFYLVLQDKPGQITRSEAVCRAVVTSIGANKAKIVKINSAEGGKDWTQEFTPHLCQYNDLERSEAGEGPLGGFISEADILDLKKALRDFAKEHVVPLLEKRFISLYNAMIVAKKRGGWRGWWMRRSKAKLGSEKAEEQEESRQKYENAPKVTDYRALADISLMLGHYRVANSAGKAAMNLCKAEKKDEYLGSLNELLGTCGVLLDKERKDIENFFEEAIHTFSRQGESKSFFRVGLMCADFYLLKGLFSDAIRISLRLARTLPDLYGGIMLEQAAFLFLRNLGDQKGLPYRPYFHKYTFHLAMAASRYSSCRLRRHAIRCFKGVLNVFQGLDWKYAEDHILFNLARQCFHTEDLKESLGYFKELLLRGDDNSGKIFSHSISLFASRQASYMKEFLVIYKMLETKKVEEIPELMIPKVLEEETKILLADNLLFSPDDEDEWRRLEEALVVTAKESSRNRKVKSLMFDLLLPISVAREAVSLKISMANSLSIALPLQNVHLVCSYRDLADSGDVVAEDAATNSLEIYDLDIDIPPQTTADILLKIKPLREGEIMFTGVSFTLFNSIKNFAKFDIQKNKKRFSPLGVKVTSKMPLLKATSSLEEKGRGGASLLHGEVIREVITLQNIGDSNAKNIYIKHSLAPFVSILLDEISVEKTSSEVPVVPPRELRKESMNWMKFPNSKTDPSLMKIPIDILLVNSTLYIPVLVKGHGLGDHKLNILFYYESEDENIDLPYRLIPYSFSLQVLPSLSMRRSIRMSAVDATTYILHAEFQNLSSVDIDVIGVYSYSRDYEVNVLSNLGSFLTVSSNGGRSNLHLALKMVKRNEIEENGRENDFENGQNSQNDVGDGEDDIDRDFQEYCSSDLYMRDHEHLAYIKKYKAVLESALVVGKVLCKEIIFGDSDIENPAADDALQPLQTKISAPILRQDFSRRVTDFYLREKHDALANMYLFAFSNSPMPTGSPDGTSSPLQSSARWEKPRYKLYEYVAEKDVDLIFLLRYHDNPADEEEGAENSAESYSIGLMSQFLVPYSPTNGEYDVVSSANLADASLIHLTVRSPEKMSHNFSSAPFCAIPVEILVRNTSNTDLEFLIEGKGQEFSSSKVEGSTGDFSDSLAHSGWFFNYYWSGITHVKNYNVKVNQVVTMKMDAIVDRPGLYNLTRFYVIVKPSQSLVSGAMKLSSTPFCYTKYQHLVEVMEHVSHEG